ncbi:MAG TPA: hypothetical protein VNN73_21545 [Blastocatellia bacterium]|nr:hypothetical protein [Blastocatellia bacterium]
MKTKKITAALMMAAVLAIGSIPAIADDGAGSERPIRLRAVARVGPIGSIRASSFAANVRASAIIDGRAAAGEQLLWGGELVQTPADRSVRITFDSIGEVTLSGGSMARFSTSVANGDTTTHNALVASLTAGRLAVHLEPEAVAYVEAAGSALEAGSGASFRVGINEEGRATIDAMSGEVRIEDLPATQQRYTLRPPAGQGGSFSVAARSTRQVQIQVTDENDRPVPDLPILFSLGDPCLGTLGAGAAAGTLFKGKTDNRGIAAVPFIAGAVRCAGTLVAKVEGTDFAYTYRVEVHPPTGFWTMRNTMLVGAAAAAGAGTGIYLGTRNNNEPIRAVPPPDVKPGAVRIQR